MTWFLVGAIDAGRMAGAIIPFLMACYGARVYAQSEYDDRELARIERRITSNDISIARQEERWLAVMARIEAQDRTLWWLVVATLSGTGVSGSVAADRIFHKWKHSKKSGDGEDL